MQYLYSVIEIEITATRNKAPPVEDRTPRTIEEYEDQEAKELEEVGKVGTGLEKRQAPDYAMSYQQSVSAEDVYLQVCLCLQLFRNNGFLYTFLC